MSGPFSQKPHKHCKVITVSFAIAPLVQHYGHQSLTASARAQWEFVLAFHKNRTATIEMDNEQCLEGNVIFFLYIYEQP